MAKKPLKSKPKPKKANSLKRVSVEKTGPASSYDDISPPDWTIPSAHSLKLDEARLAHWRAKIEGGDTVATLKAWAALLHIPRTRVTANG